GAGSGIGRGQSARPARLRDRRRRALRTGLAACRRDGAHRDRPRLRRRRALPRLAARALRRDRPRAPPRRRAQRLRLRVRPLPTHARGALIDMAARVVVFDLDGTISNPLLGFSRSINHALSLQGLPERAPADLARFIGPPLYESAVELTVSADPDAHARLIADYRQRYGETGYAENTLYDGIPAVLHALRASGATLGLCTSKRADFAERILQLFGLRELFAFVSGGDIGVHKWQQLQALRAARGGWSPSGMGWVQTRP